MTLDEQKNFIEFNLFLDQNSYLGLQLEEGVHAHCSAVDQEMAFGNFHHQLELTFNSDTIAQMLELDMQISSEDLQAYLAAYLVLQKVYRFLQNNQLGLSFREVLFTRTNPITTLPYFPPGPGQTFRFNLEIECFPIFLLT